MVIGARILAAVIVLVGLPLLWYAPVIDGAMDNAQPIQFALFPNGLLVTAVDATKMGRGVAVGDTIDTSGLSALQRMFPWVAALHGRTEYRLHHNGAIRTFVLQPPQPPSPAQIRSSFLQPAVLFDLILQSISLLVAALVLWRRPGAIAFFFAWFAAGAPLSGYTVAYLTASLPDAVYQPLVVFVAVVLALGPTLALVEFALLFPEGSVDRRKRWPRFVETLLLLTLALYAIDVFRPQSYDVLFYTAVPIAATLLTLVIVIVKYALSSGQDRRRIAWVLAGVTISSVAYAAAGLPFAPLAGFSIARTIVSALYSALPILLAYAILRHRVIDVGFALNRTLVFGFVTGAVVVGVSAADWLSEHYIASTNLSLALDALIAISFGVTLNRLHRRIEGVVDRILFRERHRAFSAIAARIRALDFAESSVTVDEALAIEPARILNLVSAAVFRVAESGDFLRVAAVGWDGSATTLPAEHVLLRTLRADERTIALADRAIGDRAFPRGAQRPDIAIPIGLRHQLLGCIIYGHRDGDAALDPEETALLEQLAHAASVAYDAIEAARWRNRALAFERIPQIQ